VFERLYHQAVELRQKIEEKKARLAFEEVRGGRRIGSRSCAHGAAPVSSRPEGHCGVGRCGSNKHEWSVCWQRLFFVRPLTRVAQDAAVSSMRFQRTWISQEMMRERTSGPYGNYGEMLYAESVEGIARKTQMVGSGGWAGPVRGRWAGASGRTAAGDNVCVCVHVCVRACVYACVVLVLRWAKQASYFLHARVWHHSLSSQGRREVCHAKPAETNQQPARALLLPSCPPQAERQRAQRAAAELQSATFSPEITRLAHQLRTRKEGAGVPAWERLSKGARSRLKGPKHAQPSGHNGSGS
jgi:hypothetical protein